MQPFEKELLHSCCAPCSAAILEWMQQNGYAPTIFFYNPNIYPLEEYLHRKGEIIRYASQIGVPIVDFDSLADNSAVMEWTDAHNAWRSQVEHLADQPERGSRCLLCFKIRMAATAKYAAEHGFPSFTTSLSSSRWKDIDQVFEAGRYAASLFPDGPTFWDKNWRKGGLYERRNLLAKQFYNQQYCGCEFSMRGK